MSTGATEYPRVLVVNHEPFWSGSATGVTMSSLFRSWPKDRLMCLYSAAKQPEISVCERYWRFYLTDLRFVHRLFNGLSLPNSTKPILFSDQMVFPDSAERGVLSGLLRVAMQFRQRLAGQSLRELDVYRISPDILHMLDEFHPQVIYSMLASNAIMQLAIDLSDYFSIPIVPHFMDDWPLTLYWSSILGRVLRAKMASKLHTVLLHSPIRLVISDAMAEEYIRRYGGRFEPFMNAVEPVFLEHPGTLPPMRERIKMVYVGGLHLNRWRSLHEIGLVLRELWQEGIEVEALIYTQPRYAQEAKLLNIPPVMQFAGSLSFSEVPDVLRDADILIHVESFDSQSAKYARYSLSSKIPEIMSAARPILAYGPRELASIRYVHDCGVGLAVCEHSRQALRDALLNLVMSRPLREILGQKGYMTAMSKHNALQNRKRFRSLLSTVATQAQ